MMMTTTTRMMMMMMMMMIWTIMMLWTMMMMMMMMMLMMMMMMMTTTTTMTMMPYRLQFAGLFWKRRPRIHCPGVLQISWLHLAFQWNQVRRYSQWSCSHNQSSGRWLVPVHGLLRNLRPLAHASGTNQPTWKALHSFVWWGDHQLWVWLLGPSRILGRQVHCWPRSAEEET